ncbi:MAG TPA: PilZ domain-containing protein [Blastocatellia bacterium]|nr:PilZ domain-containing protein [Blastocatellia bacterium]
MQLTKATSNRELQTAPAATGRRRARRYGVTWPIIVRGLDPRGKGFQEFAFLKNLSATGACFALTRVLAPGAAIEMNVRTPLSRKQWLRYVGKVVYAGQAAGPQFLGVRFDSVRPAFVPAAAVTCLRPIEVESCLVH